ncbi:FAD-dependent oxidoreductase [Actinosynnema sp. ALI-1.44]|uniref:phytoene desaturase family protein n=1 Tax=Actinosynnema sp. ALI-1.44 TaxID=1933779 RepID=UPI00097CB165|nr:NAD(P)/FAD-dependent oxidoreductase [Actinosynnema sp. ALI-1.44]ONI90327.1 FAD-dependent oxidoreductase [Actinosynnema sp. ALI-1.44]
METWDAVIVGSGHNALVAGALLARAGWGVLVLEERDRPGGFVRTEELTLPGFHHDTYSTAHPLFTGGPAYAELAPDLAALGLLYRQPRYWSGISMPGQGTAVFSQDLDETVAEFDRLSPGDGGALAGMLADFEPYAGPVFELMGADLATKSREIHDLFHDEDGRFSAFAHLFTRTGRDLLTETFTSPVVRGGLAPWALHLGRGPDEVNSALWVILVQIALSGAGMPTPAGGSGRLAEALVRLIEHFGGSVRTGQRVERILVENGQATGVRVAGGDTHRAGRAVVASVNPDQLYLELLEAVPDTIRRQAGKYRYGRGCFQLHLALSEPPRFADERLALAGQPHLSGGLDALSRSVNEATRGLLPAEPTISFDSPSTVDPERCPPGRAVARLQLLDVPTRPIGDAAGLIETNGWTEDVKNAFADRVIEVASRSVLNLPDAILGMHVTSPAELAKANRNTGPGDPYGGSHDLAQSYVFRPLPAQPSHQTVVPGLWMLGAATWPGHGVNGASGYIVAKGLLD